MVWPSFTNHSSFVCCSLLDHWLCPYVHSSTIQTPLLGHKTKGIFSVLLWLGPHVQPVRNGPYLNLSISSFGVFVENRKRLSWYTSFWDGLVDIIILCSCTIVWVGNQLFSYRYCFCSLTYWSICMSDEYLSQHLQLRHSEVAWLSWESEVQDQLNDIQS